MFYERRQRKPSPTACIGGLFAAAGIALAAYAAHGAAPASAAQSHLQTAALYLFGNGIGLAALAAGTTRTVGKLGLLGLAVGALFFSGSLAMNAILGSSTALAPLGGSLMIAGWALWAFDAVRS